MFPGQIAGVAGEATYQHAECSSARNAVPPPHRRSCPLMLYLRCDLMLDIYKLKQLVLIPWLNFVFMLPTGAGGGSVGKRDRLHGNLGNDSIISLTYFGVVENMPRRNSKFSHAQLNRGVFLHTF